jgi:hypothetical protein
LLATVPRSTRETGAGFGASEHAIAIAETITNDTASAMRAPVPPRTDVRLIKAAVLPLSRTDSAGFGRPGRGVTGFSRVGPWGLRGATGWPRGPAARSRQACGGARISGSIAGLVPVVG